MNQHLLTHAPIIPNESPSVASTNEGVENCIPEQAIQPHDTTNNSKVTDLSDNSTKAQRARLLACRSSLPRNECGKSAAYRLVFLRRGILRA